MRSPSRLRFLLKVPSVVLADLVLEENAFPEFLQENCTPRSLPPRSRRCCARARPERNRQLAALAHIPEKMMLDGTKPSERAAETVLAVLNAGIRKRLEMAPKVRAAQR